MPHAPEPADFNGQVGKGWLAQKEVDSFKLYTTLMNNVVVALDAGLIEVERLARSIGERFGPETKRMFNLERFADLTFPSDEEFAKMRKSPNPPVARLDRL